MAVIERTFTLKVPSSTENLAMIREFLNGVLAQTALDQSDVGKLEMAVDEACANVIEHAYDHDATKEVVVRVIFDEELVRINIIDTGRGFDPQSIPQADLERLVAERRSGGLGLRLMKSLVDEVRYEFEPGQKNELHMTKRIKKTTP
ncbi:MAG TPA: ATP-binding protein [Pyrinomonadaceae bacterium]|jgi:anti-sigma regulatory factor (Ser/Thr protein kinase)|nr:ATP-binding protein [Pyrinomonadaceae bacterium]